MAEITHGHASLLSQTARAVTMTMLLVSGLD
jgi:hypothetical protein